MSAALSSAVAVLICCIASCATQTPGPPQLAAHPGDPQIVGNTYLLSDTDFRAALSVARAWLSRHRSLQAIHSFEIYSATSVGVFFDESHQSITAGLMLQRIGGQWRITRAVQFGTAEKVQM